MKEVVMIANDSGGLFRAESEARKALEETMHTQLNSVANKLVHHVKVAAIKEELLRNIDVLATVAKIRKELDRGVERLI